MKNSLLIIIFIACFQTEINAQTIFELDGTQSMLMTGKGPGQDATINPYEGEDCYAVIKNLGDVLFSVRIQQKGQIIDIFPIESNQTIKYKLLVGQELYLDAESKNIAKARIDYEKIIKSSLKPARSKKTTPFNTKRPPQRFNEFRLPLLTI